MTLDDQLAEFSKGLQDHLSAHGRGLANRADRACRKLLIWNQFLRHYKNWHGAEELLGGAQAASLEVATYLAAGLGRAAIAAIRAQVDLLLAFTYFGLHPEEWKCLSRTGDGFMSRSEILEYHGSIDKGFKQRLNMVEQASKLRLQRLYAIASAHIHGQSSFTVPRAGKMANLLVNPAINKSIVELQEKTSEALSNYLLALYAKEWPALPTVLLEPVTSAMSPEQKVEFYR